MLQQQTPQQGQTLRQTQRLMMAPEMQQALQVLQLPLMELQQAIELEVEQNPLLEYAELESEKEEEEQEQEDPDAHELNLSEDDFSALNHLEETFEDLYSQSEAPTPPSEQQAKLRSFLENSIPERLSLFESLVRQSHDAFDQPEDLALAEVIIGSLDERGFLETPLAEIAVTAHSTLPKVEAILKILQRLDPPGIAARSTQEALLLQLIRQGKQETLAFRIISDCYDELLHNKMPKMKRRLKVEIAQLQEVIHQDILPLDLHPGLTLCPAPNQPLIADVIIRQDGDSLIIELPDDAIPPLRLNRRYLALMNHASMDEEGKQFLRQKLHSAHWFLHTILQRNTTLERIAKYLSEKQNSFFLDPKGLLAPLTMKEVAEELELNESTIARAVANKNVECPRGLLPLRGFFTNSYTSSSGEELSSSTIRDKLIALIEKEDKQHPLSDLELSQQIKAQGIPCARRTIAKYRAFLNVGNAYQRRVY